MTIDDPQPGARVRLLRTVLDVKAGTGRATSSPWGRPRGSSWSAATRSSWTT